MTIQLLAPLTLQRQRDVPVNMRVNKQGTLCLQRTLHAGS